MPEKNPTVSVIIPTYNRVHLVGRAIRSVLNQTYQDFEIIVVDDGSTDNTEEVVESFNDPRIRYIRHEKNRGGSAARNTGIRASRGEYVAFLDSDDEWLPEKLEKQLSVFEEDSTCGAVYTDFLYMLPDGNVKLCQNYHPEGWILKKLLSSNVVGTTSTVIVKRECFETVGLFDESLLSCQDWDMWIRIAKRYSFRKVPEPLTKYRVHQDRITTDFRAVWRGHRAIMGKYMADIRALGRCLEAYHNFRLGNYLCHAGEMRQGRRYLFRAVVLSPWHVKYSAYAFASLFGASGFQCLALAKRTISKLCAMFMVPLRRESGLRCPSLPTGGRDANE